MSRWLVRGGQTLEAVLADFDADAPLAQASTIPGAWYTDPRVYAREMETVFSRAWQMVAREDQLRERGQYVTAEVAGEPIVVVRDRAGALRAFYNVCRHHAAVVMTACEGRAERLKCPYHGWTYGLDGRLERTTELEGVEGLDTSGLVPVDVATWEHFVFVRLERSAEGLDGWLGERLRREVAALGLGRLRHRGRRELEVACNWKVFVDNYLDGGYHVPFLHRGLSSVLAFKDYAIDCYDRVCLQTSPIDAAGGEAQTASVRKGRAAYWWLYPNLMLDAYEGYLDTNLVVPMGVDRTKVVFDFWFGEAVDVDASIDVSMRIQEEDRAICESVQRGVRSRSYHKGRLSVRREAGENLFHRLLAADLRA